MWRVARDSENEASYRGRDFFRFVISTAASFNVSPAPPLTLWRQMGKPRTRTLPTKMRPHEKTQSLFERNFSSRETPHPRVSSKNQKKLTLGVPCLFPQIPYCCEPGIQLGLSSLLLFLLSLVVPLLLIPYLISLIPLTPVPLIPVSLVPVSLAPVVPPLVLTLVISLLALVLALVLLT